MLGKILALLVFVIGGLILCCFLFVLGITAISAWLRGASKPKETVSKKDNVIDVEGKVIE
jgi:hypothetical protein